MADTPRPNLLFLMTDHQRADSLGAAPAGVELTPGLNRLAAAGGRFGRAYTTCPLCVPARTALATGLYPTRNGVVCNDWDGETAGDHTPLHQLLAEAGYEVAHVGVDHIRVRPPLRERVDFALWTGQGEYRACCERVGLSESKDDVAPFRTPIEERQGAERPRLPYSNARAGRWPHPARHFKDLYWCREAADWLARPRRRPCALFLYLWAPHPPLRVPEPYASMFDPDAIDLPPNVGVPAEGEPENRRAGVAAQLGTGLSERDWRRAWAAHLGLVRLADDGLGTVLDALEAAGQGRGTVTVFTSDHGEHLGQHAMYQKMEMYEPALRVPLLVSGPGVRPAGIDTPVSHLDVMPTVLDLLGLDVPPGLDGRSLAGPLRTGAPLEDRPVFAQYSGNRRPGDMRRAVVTRRFKYVFDPEARPELYDLEADPFEMQNRAADPALARQLEELHALCAEWGRTHADPLFA